MAMPISTVILGARESFVEFKSKLKDFHIGMFKAKRGQAHAHSKEWNDIASGIKNI